jgi:hypothetical protein
MPSTVTHVLQSVLDEYRLPWRGIHGVVHWARVLENGLVLAEQTGANIEAVKLFAILHDSRRFDEGHDPEHGSRAAQFALEIRGRSIDLSDHEFGPLCKACEGHTASERIQTLPSRRAGILIGWTWEGSVSHPIRIDSAPTLRSRRQRSSGRICALFLATCQAL